MINAPLLPQENSLSNNSAGSETLPGYEKPNRENAHQFFLSTLPRRIVDTTQRTGHRLARPGEMRDSMGNDSYLYHLSTSDDALSEFGIGVGLYFQTVKLLCGVLLICACFSVIALTYNSRFNPDDTLFQLEGSVYGATRDDLKINHQGVSDIMCCIVICFFTVVSNLMEKRIVTEMDVSQQTTQDYSVECTNPPINCMDIDVYYKFFSKFGEVVLVSIAITNGALLKALADRKSVECTLQGLIAHADHHFNTNVKTKCFNGGGVSEEDGTKERESAATITPEDYANVKLSFLQRIGFAPTIKNCFDQLKKLSIDVDQLSSEQYEPWKVFVTFNSEYAQRNCLNKTSVGKFAVFMNKVDNSNAVLCGKTLHVVEASEPNDVIYETSHCSFLYRLCSWLISYFCCGVLLVGSFLIIETLSGNGNVMVAVFIAVVNASLPAIIKIMTQVVEVHITEQGVQTSMLLKLVIGRCINSAILIFVATEYHETFGEGSLLQMQNILIADAVTTPFIRLLNIYDLVMRYLVVPRYASTQEEYNAAWQGAEWNLAERYTDMLKTVFVGLFFLVPLPSGLFISSFAMLTTYLVDKYSLFRLWQRNPSIDHTLGTISRYFLVLIVFTHVAISRVYFANWPYNDNGKEAECNFFVCDTKGNEDMTSEQKELVDVYSGFSVAMFVVVVLWGIVYKIYTSVRKFYHGKVEAIGDASSITFTSVPNLEGYCPNVKRSELFSPLLCADVSRVPSHFIPLRQGADKREFSLFNFDEFPGDKINTPEKLGGLFGQMKCYNSAVAAAATGRGRVGEFGGQPLPAGWERKLAPTGQEYFIDHTTRTSHWTLPGSHQQPAHPQSLQQQVPHMQQMPPLQIPDIGLEDGDASTPLSISSQNLGRLSQLPAGWEQMHTPTGRPYYVNHNAQRTQWESPIADFGPN